MSETVFDKWKDIYWLQGTKGPIAYCPNHQQRLEIQTKYHGRLPQESTAGVQTHLVCPEDNEQFSMGGVAFWMFQRRYQYAKEAKELKNAKVYDLDNIYTPVLRVAPKKKDENLSLQFEIDKTPEGKKIVIYAADRKDTDKKSHIFIDPQKEATTFDGKDIHPNAIFAKIEITYKSGKRTTLEK